MEIVRRLFGGGLFGSLDAIVFELISTIYNLLMDIARATPFDNAIFATFAKRIYALLGLFMLFKVSFSLIQYIVNPDEFSDKTKGGKKMVMNILIVLILVVTTPMAFQISRDVQQTLLDEHVMEKLILGAGVNGQPVEQSKMGDITKRAVFSAFYSPADAACANAIFSGSTDTSACKSLMGDSATKLYIEAYNSFSIWNMIHDEDPSQGEPLFMIKKTNNEKEYAINYMYGVSTVAGVITALLFLSFCFDIAIRTVKLGFLELISPIPIISYIDPSSSKNGMFSKWLKEVGKTYLDLFIRLGALYFAITLIATLMQNNNLGTDNVLARVFIILGILIFANQVPKLIGDLFGVKLDGTFSLNPMKKINSSPLAAGVVGGAMGLAGGAAANTVASFNKFGKFNQDRIDKFDGSWKNAITGGKAIGDGGFKNAINNSRILFGPGAGAVSAGVRAASAGFTSGGKSSAIKMGSSAIAASNKARNDRDTFNKSGYGYIERNITDPVRKFAGVKNDYSGSGKMDNELNILKNNAAELALREQRSRERQIDMRSDFIQTYASKIPNFDSKMFDKMFEREVNESGEIGGYTADANQARTAFAQQYGNQYPGLSNALNDYCVQESTTYNDNVEHEKIKKEIRNREKALGALDKAKGKK